MLYTETGEGTLDVCPFTFLQLLILRKRERVISFESLSPGHSSVSCGRGPTDEKINKIEKLGVL